MHDRAQLNYGATSSAVYMLTQVSTFQVNLAPHDCEPLEV